MLTSVYSAGNNGIDGYIVTVECNVLDVCLDKYEIVGLPDAAVKEAKERVRTACENSGFSFPESSITVSSAFLLISIVIAVNLLIIIFF